MAKTIFYVLLTIGFVFGLMMTVLVDGKRKKEMRHFHKTIQHDLMDLNPLPPHPGQLLHYYATFTKETETTVSPSPSQSHIHKEPKSPELESKGDWSFPRVTHLKELLNWIEEDPSSSLQDEDEDDEEEESGEVTLSPQGITSTGIIRRKTLSQNPTTPKCSPQEYEILKDSLLLSSHRKLIGKLEDEDNDDEEESSEENGIKVNNRQGGDKNYLISLLFSHLDTNNDGRLEKDELTQENGLMVGACSLVDFLIYDDLDQNQELTVNEFYTAFNKLYSVSVISLDKALEVTHIRATVGDNVELKCDISGSPPIPILWKRYGVDLSLLNQDEDVRVFSDGTLFLNRVQLLHAGNYSCSANPYIPINLPKMENGHNLPSSRTNENDKVIQTHILTIQTLPDVKVTPHIVWEKPGNEVTMECRVMGEPFPTVRWLKNDDPLEESGDKYMVTGDAIQLKLRDIYFADTAAFMCIAENSAGKRLDIASLVVIDEDTVPGVQRNESQFFVFHGLGISVYDPSNCRIQHQIQGIDVIPGTQDLVCGDPNGHCEWGGAIRVSSSYVYVTQPKLDRVLVISVIQMVVVDVVSTDRYPVGLQYVAHLDQVWVTCWRSPDSDSQKTLQVIRDAAEKRKHHTVHPEPINSHFDLVENLFLPPDQRSSSQFRYGYVSHRNARGLYKMDLSGLRYTKSIDLTPYNCFPQHLQFSALYGMIIVECYEPVTLKPSGQLVMDAMTDAIVHFKGDRFGRPYLSPDSRKLVTVSHAADGTTLLLQLVKQQSLDFVFDVKTSLNVSDVTFFPSQRAHTYDLYASAVGKEDVLFLNMETGKVEVVSGVGATVESTPWKNGDRPISSQGLFSHYLATPSSDAVFVLNGQSHTVNCQIGGVTQPTIIVWL